MVARRLLLVVGFGLAFCIAGGLPQGSNADAFSESAKPFLEDLVDRAINALTEEGISDQERSDRFRGLFNEGFHIEAIGRFVLGRYWRAATPEQREEFLELFEDLMVETYAPRFKNYEVDSVRFTGTKPDQDGVIVSSIVSLPNSEPAKVDWRIRMDVHGNHRIVDLVIEGVSMAIAQRSDFTSVIQSRGGEVDGLLLALRDKTESMRVAPPTASQ